MWSKAPIQQYQRAFLYATQWSSRTSPIYQQKSQFTIIHPIRASYTPPKDYEDNRMIGPYPKLPYISNQTRDPWADYDFRQARRQWNEVYHEEYDMLNHFSYDQDKEEHLSFHVLLIHCFGHAAILYIIIYLVFQTIDIHRFRYTMPIEYPYNGLWLDCGNDPKQMPNGTFNDDVNSPECGAPFKRAANYKLVK